MSETGPSPTSVRRPEYARRVPPGEELGRILSLSDGVFAFSLTLLVLSLVVPSGISGFPSQVSGRLAAALQRDWSAFVAYVFAFFLIANWWVVHHRMFRYIRRYDGPLIGFNMAILLEIAVMPFVLSVFSAYSDTQVAVVLFATTQAITGLTFALLWGYASAGHRLVDADLDPGLIQYFRTRSLLTPVVFAASIALSFVDLMAAEIVWLGMIVVPRVSERYGYG